MAKIKRCPFGVPPFRMGDGAKTIKSNRKKISCWDREKIFLEAKGKCADCGLPCGGGWIYHKPTVFHFDFNGSHEIHHIIPIRCGGVDTHENLIFLCISCHKKREKILRRDL